MYDVNEAPGRRRRVSLTSIYPLPSVSLLAQVLACQITEYIPLQPEVLNQDWRSQAQQR